MAAASHRPTLWDVKFTFTGDRTFSLPCKGCGSPVETSAFNAEAPTEPAGETVGCRKATRRDCEIQSAYSGSL